MVSKVDILEALLFASQTPLPLSQLAEVAELSESKTCEELEVLREEKARIGGLLVCEVASGWQMLTKASTAPYVARLREEKRQRLSRAAFEVLAVVAYRQPVTRAEIEELRGVDCSRPLSFLLDKKLARFAGRREAPGRPWLYETTAQFLEHFGLRSIADLPPLAELAELNESTLALADHHLFSRAPMQPTASDAELPNAGLEEEESADEAGEGGIGEPADSVGDATK